jgi:hypothetical protein
MTRIVIAATLLGASACAGDSGHADAFGTWADGQPIAFEGPARLTTVNGRVMLEATAQGRPRFLGLRISYDPTQIRAPGVYDVDPAALGKLEVYCLRPVEAAGAAVPETLAYEVSRAKVIIDALPGVNGNKLGGAFTDLVLERMGVPILTLMHGSFRAERE